MDSARDPLDRLAAQLAAWARGVPDELRFWDAWLAGRGLQWPEDYARRLDPEAPLDPRVAALARGLGRPAVRVLDVGAGPLTMLGRRAEGLDVAVTATDALAPLYARLLARHGVAPPTPTRFAPAEELGLFFPEGAFDVAHCRNALDHACDPLRGIAQMLAAVRVGGLVLLAHFEDEAEGAGYAGLHQWNFSARDGRLVVWNRTAEVDVAAALTAPCRVSATARDRWVEAVVEKTGPAPPPAPGDAAPARLAAWLEAFVRVLGADAEPGPACAS